MRNPDVKKKNQKSLKKISTKYCIVNLIKKPHVVKLRKIAPKVAIFRNFRQLKSIRNSSKITNTIGQKCQNIPR